MRVFLAMFPCWWASAATRCSGAFLFKDAGPRCLSQGFHRSKSFAPPQSAIIFRQTATSSSVNNRRPPLSDLPEDPRERAYHAFSILAKKDRSWQRFRHMVDLAVDHQQSNDDSHPVVIRSITDVGTDHGLLAVGLALSGRFDSVLGVDVSTQALKNGGFQLLDKIQEVLSRANEDSPSMASNISSLLPLDFRPSDGLTKVQPGEADAVCIAGMGVNVIGQILQASGSNNVLEVDRLNCQQLILQPTNSRPRNLLQLYDMLQESDWTLLDERIEFLSRRWYLSSCFVRSSATCSASVKNLPTSKLSLLEEGDPMKVITRDYWQHHLNWIQNEDEASKGNLHEDDMRWRDWALKIQ